MPRHGSITHRGSLPLPSCPVGGAAALRGAAFDRQDSGAVWEELREQRGQVVPVELDGGARAWLLLGYNENLHALSSPALYACDRGAGEDRPDPGPVPDALRTDGQEHARLRAPIVDAFKQLTGLRLRGDVERAANELVDGFAEAGSADLVEQFAVRLPLRVVTRLLGAADERAEHLARLVVELGDPPAAERAGQQLAEELRAVVTAKREQPAADVTSWLLEHSAELTDEEAVQQLLLVLTAAHEPTANLVGNALHALLTDRGVRQELASGQVTPQEAVDQVLWRDPPLHALPHRVATRDLTLAGAPVRAGDLLVLGIAAANTDPALGAGGEHSNQAHLSWGAGPHRCPARDLARTITSAGVDTLITRLQPVRLAVGREELRWIPSPFARGLRALPVRFEPEPPSGGDPAWPDGDGQPHPSWNPLTWWRRGR